jgi:hypothetical protein
MGFLSFEQLERVRCDVNNLAPGYYIQQLDPLETLESGVGNCFSKAMLACGIIALRHSFDPAVAFSDRLHGTDKPSNKPLHFGTKRNMAHIVCLVADSETRTGSDVWGLDYGIDVKVPKDDAVDINRSYQKSEEGILSSYNEVEDYAVANPDTGVMMVTDMAEELGLVVYPWKQGGDRYLKKLKMKQIKYQKLLESLEAKAEQGAFSLD